jgi:hypothetical protein
MIKILAILLGTIMTVGCVSSSAEVRKAHLHAGLSDHEVLALESVLQWYRHYRNPKFAYQFDERDGTFSPEVKKRLATAMPEFSENRDTALFYVRVPKIEFPESKFGYAEVIVSDPFYAERYVEVFERKTDGWRIIDSITMATGTLQAIATEFDWRSYFRDLQHRRG